jgi:hypothetical protein
MTYRGRILAAAVLGLCAAHPVVGRAAEQPTLPIPVATSSSQQTADAVAAALRGSGQLQHYNVTVTAQGGTVELSGSVAGNSQRDLAVRLASGVAGVTNVVDRLTVLAADDLRQVQALGSEQREPVAPPTLRQPPAPGGAGAAGGLLPEPVPVFQGHPASPYDLNPPPMPPYSWPTYAPYNNYSRVAYPLAYPAQAWPYIGPCYPFPKVPLGWRAVKLEWEDGYWWFSKLATKHDWWRLRYW